MSRPPGDDTSSDVQGAGQTRNLAACSPSFVSSNSLSTLSSGRSIPAAQSSLQAQIGQVIDSIYEAAADASHIPRMLESLCRAVNASRGLFVLGTSCTVFHEHKVDQAPMRDGISITLEDDDHSNAAITVQRSPNEAFFNDQEKLILEQLVPHLRRMIRLRRRLDHQTSSAAASTQAVDHLAAGVIILDHAGKILFSNQVADDIVSRADGLTAKNGRLSAWSDASALSRAIVAALPTSGVAPAGSTLRIERRNSDRPLLVRVMPVDLTQCAGFVLTPASARRGAIVIINDPCTTFAPSADLLRQMFGLTPTEADIAARLAKGLSIIEIADELGIGKGTARWHLKNIQTKTDKHRQAELVILLAHLAPKMSTP
jgi:DNA-binding CsgD family transcriptional regulator